MASEQQLLDETNRRILEGLQAEGASRWPSSAGASASPPRRWPSGCSGSSAPASSPATETTLDPKAIGYPLAAVVRVRPASRQLHKIPEVAREVPEVVECYRITGEDCFVKLHLRAMEDLEPILDRFVVYGQTTTSIIHSAPVAREAAASRIARDRAKKGKG